MNVLTHKGALQFASWRRRRRNQDRPVVLLSGMSRHLKCRARVLGLYGGPSVQWSRLEGLCVGVYASWRRLCAPGPFASPGGRMLQTCGAGFRGLSSHQCSSSRADGGECWTSRVNILSSAASQGGFCNCALGLRNPRFVAPGAYRALQIYSQTQGAEAEGGKADKSLGVAAQNDVAMLLDRTVKSLENCEGAETHKRAEEKEQLRAIGEKLKDALSLVEDASEVGISDLGADSQKLGKEVDPAALGGWHDTERGGLGMDDLDRLSLAVNGEQRDCNGARVRPDDGVECEPAMWLNEQPGTWSEPSRDFFLAKSLDEHLSSVMNDSKGTGPVSTSLPARDTSAKAESSAAEFSERERNGRSMEPWPGAADVAKPGEASVSDGCARGRAREELDYEQAEEYPFHWEVQKFGDTGGTGPGQGLAPLANEDFDIFQEEDGDGGLLPEISSRWHRETPRPDDPGEGLPQADSLLHNPGLARNGPPTLEMNAQDTVSGTEDAFSSKVVHDRKRRRLAFKEDIFDIPEFSFEQRSKGAMPSDTGNQDGPEQGVGLSSQSNVVATEALAALGLGFDEEVSGFGGSRDSLALEEEGEELDQEQLLLDRERNIARCFHSDEGLQKPPSLHHAKRRRADRKELGLERGTGFDIDRRLGVVERKLVRNVRQDILKSLKRKAEDATKAAPPGTQPTLNETLMETVLDHAKPSAWRNRFCMYSLDKPANWIRSRLEDLNSRELACIVLALADAGYKNKSLMEGISKRVSEPGFLEGCSLDDLAAISLGMGFLESSGPEVVNALELDLLARSDTGLAGVDPLMATGLLYGCSMVHSDAGIQALVGAFVDQLLGCSLLEELSWSHLALTVSTVARAGLLNWRFVQCLNERISGGVENMQATEAVVILNTLAKIFKSADKLGLHRGTLRRTQTSVETMLNHIRRLHSANRFDASVVPDIIWSLAMFRNPDTKLLESLGDKLAATSDPVPLWCWVRKVLAGYAKLRVSHKGIFECVNRRLSQVDISAVTPLTLTTAVDAGAALGALDSSFLKSVVTDLEQNGRLWENLKNPGDISRLLKGLVTCRAVCPAILKSCADRCTTVDFNARPGTFHSTMAASVAKSLFAGYHHVHHSVSKASAEECFPPGMLESVKKLVNHQNISALGASAVCKQQVSETLEGMGAPHNLQVVLADGLYRADVALATCKVVLFVEGRSSFTMNPPSEPLGSTLLRWQQLEDQGIRVVAVPESEWPRDRPFEERQEYLKRIFELHGVDIEGACSDPEMKALNGLRPAEKERVLEAWVQDRTLVLQGMKRKDVASVVNDREIELWSRSGRKMKAEAMSKVQMVNNIVEHERNALFKEFSKA